VLVPRHRGCSAWAFLATYGGGLVAGDRVDLTVDVGPGAVAMIATQAETKVYRSPSGSECAQVLRARVARGGSLVVIPDPISPFAGARYVQEQRFEIDEGASLLYLDALVAGRTARGERWAFDDYRSRTEVTAGGTLILGDALALGPRAGSPLADRMGRYEALAVVTFVGPAFVAGASALLDGLGRAPAEAGAPVLATVSPLPAGALLRVATISAEHLARFLREALSFVTELLGDDPFRHRW
jgi:urease accessory protein